MASRTARLATVTHSRSRVTEERTLDALRVLAGVHVKKRDGTTQPFDPLRIERALALCFMDIGALPQTKLQTLAAQALERVARWVQLLPASELGDPAADPSVEEIQDSVEATLRAAGEMAAADHYRAYRREHATLRIERPLPPEAQAAFQASAHYFPTPLQQFQYYDKYARFNDSLGRRETWIETVERAMSFLQDLVRQHSVGGDATYTAEEWAELRAAILTMRVLPSMRLLAMAGPAAARQNLALYNCSYLPVADVDAFAEALTISMSGCGVGFSVERKYVEQFPRVQRQRGTSPAKDTATLVVEDTTEGWARALRVGITTWLAGGDLQFDLTQVRPAGSLLKVKGGRASGPEPLARMLAAIRRIILSRQGGFLTTLDAHDMMCHVGGAAVAGGTRRTAMISLFDWDDAAMRHCKDGDLSGQEQRYNANNSAVWPEGGLNQAEIMRQFVEMDAGGRGEPGIFNREAAQRLAPPRRKLLGPQEFGTNPCGEIILRPYGLCNLSIAVARAEDTPESLEHKALLATRLGCIQALATHFPGLRPEWQRNAEEERLIGVDITGQRDCPLLDASDAASAAMLRRLQQVVRLQATHEAERLGINVPAAATCVKPSGNSSVLLGCASGLHARHARHYVRNVRLAATSPLYRVLRESGAPLTPENGQERLASPSTWVVSFPVASPEGAVTRNQVSALDQCRFWLYNKRNWTEHNPSVTITYHPDELLGLVEWVWLHQREIGGMSFLPAFDAQYALMPYQEISPTEYAARVAAFPAIDYSKLYRYEIEDQTSAAQEVACMAGACEIEVVPEGETLSEVAQ